MTFELVPYTSSHLDCWDSFCEDSCNATFLHSRLFLSYHEDRFTDLSLLIMNSGKLVGLFPAAQSLSNTSLVVSHPGITYGGIIHQGKLLGSENIDTLSLIALHFKLAGYQKLIYKCIPHIYAKMPAQDDLYSLFRLGASIDRSELSSCIDFSSRRPLNSRRRRALKKSNQKVYVSTESILLKDLFFIVQDNLERKYRAKPVHTLDELELLINRFPSEIKVRTVLINGVVEAGVILFTSSNVWHAQYIAASQKAYEVSALDAVFDSIIREAQHSGARYFDFGTSNENNGLVLNDGLYRFKSEFGGGGVIYTSYILPLT